jgi:hypothetical protein
MMLLQTNAYFVPPEKRTEHSRLVQRFRHCLARLGCDQFECYEQAGPNWSTGESKNRFIQLMRFRDRKHQQQVQAAERNDPQAQALIKEFCELINFPYQQQQGYFAVGFYNSILPVAALRVATGETTEPPAEGLGEAPEPLLEQSPAPQPAATEAELEPEPDTTEPNPAAIEKESEPVLDDADIATADFGEPLDLDKELGLSPDADAAEKSTPPERL